MTRYAEYDEDDLQEVREMLFGIPDPYPNARELTDTELDECARLLGVADGSADLDLEEAINVARGEEDRWL